MSIINPSAKPPVDPLKPNDLRRQKPDLEKWTQAYANGLPVVWYSDKANGKPWGGSKKGKRRTATTEKVETVRRLKSEGKSVAVIARVVGLSRPTVYAVLAE